MPILGYPSEGEQVGTLFMNANQKYMQPITVTKPIRVAKLSALIDGQGAVTKTADFAPMAGAIYDSNNRRVAVSEEVPLAFQQERSWVDFRFDNVPGGVLLLPGKYFMGIYIGPGVVGRIPENSLGKHVVGTDTFGPVQTTTTEAKTLPTAIIKVTSTTGFDSKGDAWVGGQHIEYTEKTATELKGCTGGSGPIASGVLVEQSGPSLWMTVTSLEAEATGALYIFATYFEEAPVPAISDIQIGRYPFAEAQAVFGEDPPQEGTSSVATCSWHGTILNPERGSFCVVQRGGRFADLVGDRVRVSTFTGRAVNAYVIAEAELEDDISLTRRLFMELGLLSADDLNVRIEILSTEALE